MASLPTGLALAVRQFLGRLPTLDPASRADLGARLAAAVSEYVAPPPPPGTPPEAYLAAVVAARRERDAARLGPRGRAAPPAGPPPLTAARRPGLPTVADRPRVPARASSRPEGHGPSAEPDHGWTRPSRCGSVPMHV